MASKKYDLEIVDGLPEFRDDITGETRRCGTLPPTKESFERLARKMRTVRPVDPASWQEFEHDPGPVKVKDQDGKGACFPAGTPILLSDGSWRPIRAVGLFDRVRTAEGGHGIVTRTMARREGEEIVHLRYQGCDEPLVLTAEHPVLTEGGYVAAGRLSPSDRVVQTASGRALPVRSVERRPFDDWVFNLEVEGDHSYVAGGVGVHNCNGHACASSVEWERKIALMQHVDLSAWFPYAIMCNGIDQGSMIDEALTLATDRGIPPEKDVEYGIINPRKLSAESYLSAAKNKVEKGEMITSFDEMMYATQRFSPGNFSIRVGANFNNLDADGCPGYSPGMGNHAVCFGLGAKRGKNGEWLIKWQNSWTTKWGLNGYAWVGRKFIERQQYFSAYTVYAVHDNPDDPTNPRPVPMKSGRSRKVA